MSNKNGGAAFPVVGVLNTNDHGGTLSVIDNGMTIRQYYKAFALQGLLAGSLSTEELLETKDSDIKLAKRMISECAGELADEMLKEDEQHEHANELPTK